MFGRKNLQCFEEIIDSNQDAKETFYDALEVSDKTIIGNWKKGDPYFKVVENLVRLTPGVLWKEDFENGDPGNLAEEISKVSPENADWLLHAAYSKMLDEQGELRTELLDTKKTENDSENSKFLEIRLQDENGLLEDLTKLGTVLYSLKFIIYMETDNQTYVLEFILLGLSEETDVLSLLFGLFLSMYLVILIGNLLIILVIILDSQLHKPMYFFLSNLSFTDICFTSTTVPKMLLNIQKGSKIITFENCLSQLYFFILFAQLDNCFLTAMAYDCFVAICHPLHYTVIMNPRRCVHLLLASWLLSVLNSVLHGLMVLQLSFCTELEIPHFFCELNQVVKLACSDTFLNELVLYFDAGLTGALPLIGILLSYSKIVSSILRISTAEGKFTAFSPCGSHLSVVTLFYGTGLGVYLSSAATKNSRAIAIASVMYTVVTPMLNPFIYSLRNKDIKQALKKMRNIPSIKGYFVSSLQKWS
ncbi:olfactory receptor 7A17-like [Dasypus novemcinctus]|uniref:olfactory receptor 7A17-like n=1 Tax=Dasypus novemcinctus TaxID=9361 RepID=UPI0039C9CEED